MCLIRGGSSMSFLKSEWGATKDVVCAMGVVVVNKSGRIRDKSSWVVDKSSRRVNGGIG